MKEIKLTQDRVAIVDDEDYEWLSQYNWHFSNGYAMSRMGKHKGKIVRMHRLIMGAKKGQEIDHRNHKGTDNRRKNMRICTHQQNLSSQKLQKGKTSKYKGVSWFKRDNNWTSHIYVNGRSINLGYFRIEINAALAYDEAAKKYFGEFAYLNFKESA